MSDLIERQAAIDALDKRFDSIPMEQTAEILQLRKDLRELPSAQPERKKGHWEDVPHKSVEHGEVIVDGKTVRCSVCKHAEKGWNKGMNYCPNCGAKMEVEHEA